MRTGRVTLGALLASGLVMSLCGTSSTASADGEQAPPGAQSITRLCAGVPRDFAPFADVAGTQFEQAIVCIAYAKIAQGGPGGATADQYVPDGEVRRDAMASFVVRMMDVADRLDRSDKIRALPAYDALRRSRTSQATRTKPPSAAWPTPGL